MASTKLISPGIPNYTLKRNLRLNGNYISNDGGNEGILIQDDGDMVLTSSGTATLFLKDAGGEYISGDGTDLSITSSRDVNISTTGAMALVGRATITLNDAETTSVQNRGLLIDLNSTGDLASGSQTLSNLGIDIDIDRTGTTSHGSATVNNTGLNINILGETDGTSTNTGIDITVASADKNYALITSGGNVGIGVSDPDTPLEVLSTATQLKLSYDGDSFATIGVGSASSLSITAAESGNVQLYGNNIVFGTNAGGNHTAFSISCSGSKWSAAGGQAYIDAQDDIILDASGNLDLVITGEVDFNTSTAGFTAQAATGDGTTTIDWTNGNKFHLLFAASTNEVVTFGTNPSNPCNLLLKLKQPSSGAGSTVDWEVTSGTIYWAGGGTEDSGSEPTLSTGANDVDIISFYFDGTNYYGVASLGFDA